MLGELAAVVHTKLSKGAFEVLLDGAWRNHQALGDRPVGETARGERGHLALAGVSIVALPRLASAGVTGCSQRSIRSRALVAHRAPLAARPWPRYRAQASA